MELRLGIDPDIMTEAELKEYLEQSENGGEYGLAVREGEIKTRVVDPTILVAIVGAAGAGLGALITGLCKVAVQGSARTISIHGKGGQHLEFPASLEKDEVDALIAQVRALDADAISIP